MMYLAILVAAVAQFIIGAIWYMPIFGKTWGKIHGFDDMAPEEQVQARKGMATPLVIQFVGTVVTTIVLALFITRTLGGWSVYVVTGLFWIGFVVPTQVAAVLFGGTNPKWMVTKILIMAGASFLCLEIAALILMALIG